MKVFVKTLKGTRFEIEVQPQDTVTDVKKNIETIQGDAYPAAQQMLIHRGAVLKDGTTLEENKVAENSSIVVMLTKKRSSSADVSTTSGAATTKAPQSSDPPVNAQAPASWAAASPQPATIIPRTTPVGVSISSVTSGSFASVYGQGASSLVAGNNFDGAIQNILDMGGGTWDRDTVVRALRAAYNNPERAVEHLYSGIPESTETVNVTRAPPSGQTTAPPAQPSLPVQPTAVPSGGPNVNPLNLFPQGDPNVGSTPAGGLSLDYLRNNERFQALRARVQANPQILQPILQERGKQNPQLLRVIQEHQGDFLSLLNEPQGGTGNDIFDQLGVATPQAIPVTPEEQEAIGRLEAMGFDRDLVLDVFIACNKNEELAANYLLDHSHEFEE